MLLIDKLAEQRIREAQEKGEFDNLPGAGEPLVLDDDSMIPVELRVAYRVLKNANCVPVELQLRKEISEVEQLLRFTEDPAERDKAYTRLHYLLVKLDASGSSKAENLRNQQIYFEKLRNKVK